MRGILLGMPGILLGILGILLGMCGILIGLLGILLVMIGILLSMHRILLLKTAHIFFLVCSILILLLLLLFLKTFIPSTHVAATNLQNSDPSVNFWSLQFWFHHPVGLDALLKNFVHLIITIITSSSTSSSA